MTPVSIEQDRSTPTTWAGRTAHWASFSQPSSCSGGDIQKTVAITHVSQLQRHSERIAFQRDRPVVAAGEEVHRRIWYANRV
jgi:hypothetical protein